MKHFKALTAFACLSVIILLSSCLKSSKGIHIDGEDLVTVESLGFMVDYLRGDLNNEIYYPTNPEVLKVRNTQTGEESYLERAHIAYSYPEIENSKAGKKIKIEYVQPIPVQPLNEGRDTINLDEFGVRISNLEKPLPAQGYLTFNFSFSLPPYGQGISASNFLLFIEDFTKDTVFLRFVDYRKKSDFYESMPQGATISYRMTPETIMHQCPELDISDSINVIVKYDQSQGGEKELDSFKILVR